MANSADMFFAGGDCVLRHGVWVRRTSRIEDIGPTHTRSGAVGKFTDRDGVVREAEANQPRITWLDLDADNVLEQPALLLEAARTNVVLRSEDFTTTWGGAVTVTADQAIGADGETTADQIADDSAAAAENISQSITIADDSTDWCVSVYVHKTDHTGHTVRLSLDLTGGTAVSKSVYMDPDDGTLDTGSGANLPARYGVEELPNHWRLWLSDANNGTGNTTLQVSLYPAYGTAITGTPPAVDNTVQGNVKAWGAQVENAQAPSSYISTVAASSTRNADVFYADFPYPPQEMTMYAKFVEAGSKDVTAGAVIHIGATSSTTDPRFMLHADSGAYRVGHDNGTTPTGATLAASPSWGDTVELRGVLNADGSVLIGQSINAAAETTNSDATTATLGTAWAGTRCYIGSRVGADHGLNPILSVKIARGVRSMAYMRALD